MLTYGRDLKQHSRQLRVSVTEAEKRLWKKVRMKQVHGYWFYRQKPAGKYIVDFFCPKAKLVIEIDGSQHLIDKKMNKDRIRDEYLAGQGLKVLRFTNIEVLQNVEGVLARIEEEIPHNPPFSKWEK